MPRFATTLALLLVLTACGPGAASEEPATTIPPTTTTMEPTTTTTTVAPVYFDGLDASALPADTTLVALSRGELEVYAEPGDAEVMMTLPDTTILGTATVVTVIGSPEDGWLRVMLPVRPNGSEGWVAERDVDLFMVEGRMVIDLSDRRLTFYRDGEEVMSSSVAIGTSRNPTPTGQFYVTDNVTLSDPTSPWGPHALGLSGRSDTITEYNGGDGIIGIHGTNRPGSIGNAASLGCVRLPNDVITALHEHIAIGTPVEIRA
jgi:hypothetical protein